MATLDYAAAKAAGYTDQEISDFLQKNPQFASNDALRTITQGAAHLGKLGLKTLQQGAYAVPGFVGDVEALGNKYLPGFATQPLGSMVSPQFRSGLNPLVDAALFGTKGADWSGSGGSPDTNQLLPSSHSIEQASGKMGLNLFPSEQPQGTFEKLATAGVKALPMAAATIASGGATLPALAANVGGGIGGEMGAMATPDSPVGPIVGGLTGGLGGAVAASKGATKALARGLDERLAGAEGRLAQTETERLARPQGDRARKSRLFTMPRSTKLTQKPSGQLTSPWRILPLALARRRPCKKPGRHCRNLPVSGWRICLRSMQPSGTRWMLWCPRGCRLN